jgi:HK97 family phage portal protein
VRSPLGSLARALTNRAPVPLVASRYGGGFGILERARVDDVRLMDTYSMSGTIYGTVSRLASATSAPEWKLWRKAASGLREDRVEVTSHAALDLIRRPNPFMTLQELIETGQQHIDLTGEADILITRFGRIPLELWPVRPDRVKPEPDPYLFIKQYSYTSPTGIDIGLPVDDVIQIRLPNPLDPYSGLGPIQSILTEVDSARYSAEWNKNFFINSAQPGGIIETPNRLGDTELTELRDRWAESHKGASNAHRVAIIENGMKWVERTTTQRDMQFAELRGVTRDAILEAFGFPKFALGIVEDVNRASADASEYLFQKWLIVPRLNRWRSALNNDLLPQFAGADQLEFDYESPLSEDTEAANQSLTAKWNAAVAAVGAGFDAPEALKAIGLPDVTFEKPAPPAPPVLPGARPGESSDEDFKNLARHIVAEYENAMKWEAVEEDDDSTCEHCIKNRGKLYRNREDAYADYPNGKGYKDCIGAEFGNDCRGYVRKRKASE